jgi:polyisoprenoid-binding protein YceI
MPWEYDTVHSYIGFIAKHLGINTVHGYFESAQVSLNLDSDDPTQWSIKATIQAASINTAISRRDDALRGEGYLDAERFPTITFESKRVERRGQRYWMVGALTLHGVARDVDLDVAFNGEATDREMLKRGFSAQGEVDRFQFEVGEPAKTPTVGKEIRFVLNMEAIKR